MNQYFIIASLVLNAILQRNQTDGWHQVAYNTLEQITLLLTIVD